MSDERAKDASGPVIPRQAGFGGRVLARMIWWLTNLLVLTLRWRVNVPEGLLDEESEKPVILCIWHNRLALSLILYRKFILPVRPSHRLAAMVSASRDGGMLARVLELASVKPIRGSSSRRGSQALKEAVSCARDGFDLAITPDGPRGPKYTLHPGVVSIAQLSGCRIIPVSYDLSWKITLNSWDKFQVPLPFARVDFRLGEAIEVPRRLDSNVHEKTCEAVRQKLMELTDRQ